MTTADRQSARDTAYARAYEDWVASLPPAERAQLAAQGIAAPDTSRHTSTRQGDATILKLTPATAPTPDTVAATADEPASSDPQLSTLNSQPAASVASDMLASFCSRIRSHPNPLLAFDAACFASGLMALEGRSEKDLAARHGVTRAAFSKLAVEWAETFGLPPSRGMRSQKARRAYRKARLTYLAKQHDRLAA